MNGVKVVDENLSRELLSSLQPIRPDNPSLSKDARDPDQGQRLQVNSELSTSQLVEELLASTARESTGKVSPISVASPVATPSSTNTVLVAPQIITSEPAQDPLAPLTINYTVAPTPQTTTQEQEPPRIAVSEIKEREKSNPVLPTIKQAAGRLSGNRQQAGTVPVILFEGVSKIYPSQPNKPALNNVSMSINAGEFIFLVGHSGSGKSTFIRLINRELVATRGRLAVAGEDVIRMRNWRVPYLRRNIGCVFQDFKLLPNKTAFGNVAFALEVIGKSKHIIRTQVPEVLRLVGLEDKLDKYPDQLSGGEQQRVSIARAIVNRPPLLICDEPTGNLDPQTSLGIMRLLDRINRTGTTILVATHDREMVDSLRKRVVELENGYLVRDQDRGVYGEDA